VRSHLIMPLASWKQELLRERTERLSEYYEDESAYQLMEDIVTACDAHLERTSLEHLASLTDSSSSTHLPLGLTLDSDELDDKVERLRDLFLRDFVSQNVPRSDSRPNKNELQFMALSKAHYVLRSRTSMWAEKEPRMRLPEHETEVLREFMDARSRLAQAMSVHGHLVSGKPYENRRSRAQRRRENRMDFLCPSDLTLSEWHDARLRQEEEAAHEVEAERKQVELVNRAAAQMRRRKHHDSEEDEDDDDPVQHRELDELPRREWAKAASFPNVAALTDEIAFFLTTYFVEGVDALDAALATSEISEERLKQRNRLTNGASKGGLGLVWKDDDHVGQSYLKMSSQFLAQVWTEQRWRRKFPTTDVVVAPAERTTFGVYVADRLEVQMQEEQIKEFSANAYELLLPIGGRGLARRELGTRGGAARKLVHRCHGKSVVEEIDELFDTEAATKLIGYDSGHPLHDALAMMLVQTSCYGAAASNFSMVERCTVASSELITRGVKTDGTPLIVRAMGEWLIHDGGRWHRPMPENSFATAWLVFLRLLKARHRFSVDAITELSYWQELLGGLILQAP